MIKRHYDKIKGKRVVVTGGLGFVGHNLVKSLVNDYDCQVTVVDDCTNSSEVSIKEVRDKVDFQKISVLDSEKLFPLLRDTQYIFHLACIQIAASGSNPILDMQVNAQSTLQILEHLRHQEHPALERFVYTSSCSVYGSSSRLPVGENDPTRVLSNYAATKLLGEHYTLIYNRNYNIPISVVRYSNVYGFGQSPRNPYCGVLGKFVHNALTGQPLSIFGDGEQTRDYTFISDAVDATILSAVHPMAYGDVFNVGTSVETSVNKLVQLISNYVPGCTVVNVQERDIDNIRRRMIDIEKIHQRLGWTPRVGMQKGIELTMDWYKTTL
ncbi:NAD-dependent epimerase/dehydratase family protein [Puia dinghuensis]|uniref:UDP-glucose 4-epimerase n=1 Tax=Puia dinghuensis TaxID=1792502 RepID=A0A8J2UEZ2_9BACT|nr:NAD-dependent epimerase/dehydratase family protein [Puia dinghuensis]GGB08467.1 UDP-glucose 4-epimerase [Puia dinghuensis]